MKPITDPTRIENCGRLVREMMLTEKGRECEFNPDWVRQHGWKILPAESAMRLPDEAIPGIVSALKGAGYAECFTVFNEPGYIERLPLVIASEPPSNTSTCHLLSVDEADFREFNRELGPFRSVLTTEDRSWAISCNEWYNLFGAKPELVETILGKPIKEARQEFFEYASLLATGQNPDKSILQVAKRYAEL